MRALLTNAIVVGAGALTPLPLSTPVLEGWGRCAQWSHERPDLSGELPLELERLDVTELLGEQAQAFARAAEEKGLELAVEPTDGSVAAVADAGIISRVVMNLLQNAIVRRALEHKPVRCWRARQVPL